MKVEFFINWDFVGLMLAMILYPVWSLLSIVATFIRALKHWSEKQINE